MSEVIAESDFDAQLQEFVGLESGPARVAPDDVNIPMIRHWCEAAGDANPVYLDEEAAAASAHGGIVAPPTMLQVWVMAPFGTTFGERDTPGDRLTALLREHGFTSVVATNCEQTYHRYLRPGDRLTMRSTIEAVSSEKQTTLGTGHFVTTQNEYFDADGELVGSMLFRIIRFKPLLRSPATQAVPESHATRSATTATQAAADRSVAGAPSLASSDTSATRTSARPAPALTADNAWWFNAVEDGRLLIQRCTACSRLRHPPQPMCPSCRSLRWDAIEAAGRGSIHSFVITHHPQVPGFDYPLPIVLVDLDEGVRMVMNTADTDPDDIAIGVPVTVTIRQADSARKLPFAVLVPGDGS